MRDDRIYQMQEANAKRSMLLLRQFEFLKTRQEALEQIVMESPWSAFMWIVNRRGMMQRIDNRQKELLTKADEQMKAAQEKPHIQPISLVTH